jgi:hypothetical protein
MGGSRNAYEVREEMSGYFESMRRTHPVKLGEVIDGKRVVETFWQWTRENGNVPMYRTEGETVAKAAS